MNKKLSVKDRAMLAMQSPMVVARPAPAAADAAPPRPKTGPGAFVAHLAKESEVLRENLLLKEDLKTWSDATPAKKLDAALVLASRWANRHEDSFKGEAFEGLKADIYSAGGNVQAIKVRPIPGSDPQQYEVVFGHRRHRACLELGLPVLAVVEPITEQALFQEMDRENRQREDLRPYEQGEMYRRALDEALFPSLRKLAESIGATTANVSLAVKIARLPEEVLGAFPSRLDIQYRWSAPLADALEKDAKAVLDRAQAVALARAGGEKLTSQDVFKRLVNTAASASKSATRQVFASGKTTLSVTDTGTKVVFELQGVRADVARQIEKLMVDALRR